jgi:hypothetical protein
MRWCERNDVDYVIGLAKNSRLHKLSAAVQLLFCKNPQEIPSG